MTSESQNRPQRKADAEPGRPERPAAGLATTQDEPRGRLIAGREHPPLVVLGRDDQHSAHGTLEQILALTQDEAFITALWHHACPHLIRQAVAKGLPIDAADDVLQEVFSLLAAELDRVRGPRIMGWLRTMVDYQCMAWFSSRRRARRNLDAATARQDSVRALPPAYDPERPLAQQRELDGFGCRDVF